MIKATKNILTLVSLSTLMLSGCSGIKKNEGKDAAQEIIDSKSDQQSVEAQSAEQSEADKAKLLEAFRVLDERMKSMVATAKKEGPAAIEYLSSDLFIKANDSSMRGDSHTAAYLYKQLLELKPEDIFVKKKYGVELIRMGNLGEAKVVLEDLLKETKYKEEALGLILGGVYTALNDTQNAKSTYQNVLKNHPASEEACVFLAKAYSLEAQYKNAHGLLAKCSKKANAAIFHYYRAKVYLKQNKEKSAISFLRKALKADSSFHQAAMAMGLMSEEKGKMDKAVGIYERFLKKNPRNFQVLSRLVQVLFAQEKFEKVLPYAETLSSLDQTDLNLRVRLGILYTDSEKYKKAIGVFKEILAAVPDSDKVLYYLGSLYQKVENPELAIESFGKIEEESSLYVDSSMQIARLLQLLVENNEEKWAGDYKDFLSSRGDKVKSLQVEFHMMLATYFEGKKNYNEAISSIEKVRHTGDYTEGHEYYLASLYEKVEDFDKARGIVQEILDKNPENAHALNFLGYSLLEKGDDMERAYSLIQKAVNLEPEDGYIRDSLGWYYYKTGQLDKALVEVKKAFELEGSDVVIAKHLAIIYKEMKKYEKAKRYFVEALKNCKLESERQDVMEALQGLKDLRLPASSSAPAP
ncbi:MAG: tetratricopeptide repeat protein [Bdellovibrionota bacterium]|nr:tetratricopeptide repeat protein [Bdellovibrionota bacterium]